MFVCVALGYCAHVFYIYYRPRNDCMQAKDARRHLHDRLGRYIETDQYEDAIASEVANPNSIDVTLEDIGGLEETKNVLVISLHSIAT